MNQTLPSSNNLDGVQTLDQPLSLAEQSGQGVWSSETPAWLTIVCRTYQHEAFIAQCLDGFLAQETTFKVEILVHDDASQDQTAQIVKAYQQRHPGLIRLIEQTENQFSKGRRAQELVLPHIHTPYVADCEGDDYWTDPHKLQIQVDYLEAHHDVVVTGHDAFIESEQGERLSETKLPQEQQRDFTGLELMCGQAWILTLARVYRNVLSTEPIPERQHILNGDNFTTALLGRWGGAHYHTDIAPAAYRVHAGGVWSSLSLDKKTKAQLQSDYWIHRYFARTAASWEERAAAQAWFLRWLEGAKRASAMGPAQAWVAVWGWRCRRWIGRLVRGVRR